MATYQEFKVQKEPIDPQTAHPTYLAYVTWGIYVKHFPFNALFPELKDLPSHTWADEHGDDEYVSESPYFKSQEIEVDFVFIGNSGNAKSYISSFITFLANGGTNKIYDTYTGIGKQKVRYVSFNNEMYRTRTNDKDIVEFSVKFKLNDPVTNITL